MDTEADIQKKNNRACYTWKLPSLTAQRKLLLCHAWTRMNYSKFIITPLIHLFARFYSNDAFSLSAIKNAEVAKRFHGPIISVNSFKFYIELYPNGTTSRHAGQVAAFFCIASLPPTVSSIELTFGFQLKESSEKNSKMYAKSYEYNMDTYWRGIYAQTSRLKDLTELTFDLFIEKLTVNYKNAARIPLTISGMDIITNPIKEQKPQTFLWEVTDTQKLSTIHNAPNIFGFASPIFVVGGIKFYLSFYPNGSKIARKTFCNVYLHLAALKKTNMQINVRHSEGLQGDLHMRSSKFITVFDIDKSSWGLIERSTYATADLIHLKNFLCVAEVILLDIYDNEDVCGMDELEMDTVTVKRCKSLNMYCYEWKLNDEMMEFMKQDIFDIEYSSPGFEIFGLNWNLILYPRGKGNGDDSGDETDITIGLTLEALDKMYTISVRCTFQIIQLNVRYITTGFFDENIKNVDWGNGRVLTDDIKKLHHCTIKIGMELVDVYKNGVSVTESVKQMGDII